MYRHYKEKDVKKVGDNTYFKYREIRGLYEINIIRNDVTSEVTMQFQNFTDINLCIKLDDLVDPLYNIDVTYGNSEFPTKVELDELPIIGEELIKIHDFISSVRRDWLHNN